MGKKASFPMRKLFKVAAKAKCVAKAKAKSKPLKKGLKKAPSKTLKGVAKPTKKNVKKLGKEKSLVEKVQALAKGAQTAEEAVEQVQQGLDKLDKSKLWSQHQSHLKKDPEAKEERAKLGKKEKGAEATLWFLRKKVPQFASFSEQRQESTTLRKVDKWMSEKEALTKWSDQELEAHCQSGRVQWRECPTTWGVKEYRDNHDSGPVARSTTSKPTTRRKKAWRTFLPWTWKSSWASQRAKEKARLWSKAKGQRAKEKAARRASSRRPSHSPCRMAPRRKETWMPTSARPRRQGTCCPARATTSKKPARPLP